MITLQSEHRGQSERTTDASALNCTCPSSGCTSCDLMIVIPVCQANMCLHCGQTYEDSIVYVMARRWDDFLTYSPEYPRRQVILRYRTR